MSGWRKRDRDEENVSGSKKSHLANFLLEEWGFGRMSAVMVQKMAMHSYKDFQSKRLDSPEDLKDLAMLGSQGEHPQNCHRDLTRWIKRQHAILEPSFVQLPMRISHPTEEGPTWKTVDHAMLFPHDIFAHLYEHNRLDFNHRFLGVREDVQPGPTLSHFWNSVHPRDPKLQPCQPKSEPDRTLFKSEPN